MMATCPISLHPSAQLASEFNVAVVITNQVCAVLVVHCMQNCTSQLFYLLIIHLLSTTGSRQMSPRSMQCRVTTGCRAGQ